jgi:hypothetical protein
VIFAVFGNLFDDRRQGSDTSVADRLAPDLENVDVRKKLRLGGYLQTFGKRLADKAFSHQLALYVQTATVALAY